MTVNFQHGAGYHKKLRLTVKVEEAIRERGFPMRRGQWVIKNGKSGRFLNVNKYGIMNVAWANGDGPVGNSRRLHDWTTLHNIRKDEVRQVQRATIISAYRGSRNLMGRIKDVFV